MLICNYHCTGGLCRMHRPLQCMLRFTACDLTMVSKPNICKILRMLHPQCTAHLKQNTHKMDKDPRGKLRLGPTPL